MASNSTAGRRARRSSHGPSVSDVVDELLRAADQGLVRDAGGHRLTTAAVRELHWALGGYVRESLGRVRLTDVRPRDVADLLDDLEDSGLSSRRLHPVLESVRTLFDYAIERGLTGANPAGRVAPADEPSSAPARPDRVIALALRLATAGFALTAGVFFVQALVG